MRAIHKVCLDATLLAAMAATSSPVLAQSRVERNVVYGMYSGLGLLLDVHYPANPNGYGIIFVYGSGFHTPLDYDAVPLKESGLEHYPLDALVQGGYTVFAINHRAAPRFRYPANVEDGQRAVRFVRSNADRFGIDADRIGAFGASSGGYLSNMLGLLATESPTTSATEVESESAAVQAVVSMYAPSDLVAFTENREGDQERIPSFMGMPLNIAQDLYREASPVTHVSADDPPFLLIHGDMDETVPFNQSVLLYERLQALGVPGEFIRMPGGTHGPGIRADASAPDYFRATVEWFDRHLRQ